MVDRICSVDGCGRKYKAHGLCNTHNERRRKGQPLETPVELRRPPGTVCAIDGCERTHYSRGWCQKHYERWDRHGDPLKSLHGNTDANFLAKIDKNGPQSPHLGTKCWVWTSTQNSAGYGLFWNGAKNVLAHRHSYQREHGSLDDTLTVDHRCGNSICVRPTHLRPATDKQNNEHRTRLNKNNSSGVAGVYWCTDKQRWSAAVVHNYRRYHVGYFIDIEDAADAVVAKRNELFTHNDRDRIA